jgi:hypothetical protein
VNSSLSRLFPVISTAIVNLSNSLSTLTGTEKQRSRRACPDLIHFSHLSVVPFGLGHQQSFWAARLEQSVNHTENITPVESHLDRSEPEISSLPLTIVQNVSHLHSSAKLFLEAL